MAVREAEEELTLSETLFGSGIEYKLDCDMFMNRKEVESEVKKASDDCVLYLPNIYGWSWLGVPNWFYQMYAEDYLSRM